ncbi:efflux RND transporter permease subunit [Patulibacter defluvii]|uniref:efflux RND transporter permease subunit n=1 Tax=Patulibacter defluvii TaxID=3095358 RepID=UPI002A74B7B5|nr:MMPL family transporter [Patulibacter sp. DM4]
MARLVAATLRHPRRVAAVALLLLALAVVGLTQLGTSAAVRTVVGTGSEAYRADRESARLFGDEAIVVLVKEKATDLTLTDDIGRVISLEGCLAGKIPADAPTVPGGADGPCAQLRELAPAKVVYGPGTFVNSALAELDAQIQGQVRNLPAQQQQERERAEAAARKRGLSAAAVRKAGEEAASRLTSDLLGLAQQYGINPLQPQSVSNTALVNRILFDTSAKQPGTPKQRFAAVLPTPDAALISLRLRPDLDDDGRRRAVALVRQAVALDDFRLARGGSYVVSGSPALVDGVAHELEQALLALLAVGVLVMALVLALTFPERRRLQPLLLALGTLGVVFGGIGLLGLSVNLGTIATLPVLLGLAVDYGVQLHARVEEERRRGLTGEDAVRAAVVRGGRPVLIAAGATLAGFLVLLVSPTPLVRGFALVLLTGVALAVVASFTVGLVLHALVGGGRIGADGRDRGPRGRGGRALATVGRRLRRPAALLWTLARPLRWLAARIATLGRRPATALARRARAIVVSDPTPAAERGGVGGGPVVRRVAAFSHRWPVPVVAVGVVLAIGGAILGAREPVETDLQRLVPSDLPALRDLHELERSSGVAGEIQVLVEARSVTTPAVLRWIADTRRKLLADARYDADAGCRGADLCPLASPTDLLSPDLAKTQAQADELVRTIPDYFLQSTVAPGGRAAIISFGLRLGSLEHQRAIVERMRRALRPPAGVRATVTGLPVLVADASVEVSSSSRRLLTLFGSLILVGGLLVAFARSWRRGLAPLVPVALAAGWSGLLTWLLGLPLNPLSVVLGALVVAIGTEFSVLLSERYQQERRAGHGDAMAIARTARSTGRAVGASAATAIAGFAVLAVSDIPLLRQFGLVTVLDLLVAVAAVVLVLPALAALAERRRTVRA